MATDYISREAALACFSDWIDSHGHEHSADEMVEYQRIEDLPVADVVEVVRCKDCVHFVEMGNIPFLVCEIGRDGSRNYGGDFCSRGVRREP